MERAVWNETIVAESDDVIEVDGYAYFPLSSLKQEHFRPSQHTSVCGWKGTASYFDLVVGDQVNANAAWIYREPKSAASHVAERVAFWKGVKIERVRP